MNGFRSWFSPLTSDLWNLIPDAWQECLSGCRSEIETVDELLFEAERLDVQVVPMRSQIFASLALAPSEVSVVVLGQDPYPDAELATGFAFGVPKHTKPLPGSLKNIFKEVINDTGMTTKADCTLQSWTEQGVLLLNTSLTTQAGVRAGHQSWPWNPIIRSVLSHVVEVNPNVVAVLWGNHAKQYAELFNSDSIVQSMHPSPLSANRGFLGSKPFSRVNEILEVNLKPVITW